MSESTRILQPSQPHASLLATLILVAAVVTLASPTTLTAQAADRFELRVPGTDVVSQAILDGDNLQIADASGQRYRYTRKPEYDSADGTFRAYFSASLGKVVRWPASNRGALQLGDGPVGPSMTFRESRMQVSAAAVPATSESSETNRPLESRRAPRVGSPQEAQAETNNLTVTSPLQPQPRLKPPEELPGGGQQRPPLGPQPPLPPGLPQGTRPPLTSQQPPFRPGPNSTSAVTPVRPGEPYRPGSATTAWRPTLDPNPKPTGFPVIRVLTHRRRGVEAAWIDHQGQPQFAVRRRDGQWDQQPGHLDHPLPPNAPVAAMSDADQFPMLFAVGPDGRLNRVEDGFHRDRIASHELVPQAHLEIGHRQQVARLWSVDQRGRLVELRLDRAGGETRFVDPTPGGLIPGSALAAVDGSELLVTDPLGMLRRYVFRGDWQRQDPLDIAGRPLSAAFQPGGGLAAMVGLAAPQGPPRTHCFTWNAAGRLQVAYASEVPGGWRLVSIDDARGYPGSPIAVSYAGGRWSLSIVGVDGTWAEWSAELTEGPWRMTPIASGLSPRTATGIDPSGSHAFAIDRRGDLLVASRERSGRWSCVRCGYEPTPVPRPDVMAPPVLVSRQVIAGAPLSSASVTLLNRHQRELWVVVTDLRNPEKVARFKIPVNGKQNLLVDRDAGSRIIETWQLTDPFGGTRVERNVYEVPPQSLYEMSVYERILQSVAIDRTARGKGKIEETNWSPRSIGSFLLAAGPELPATAALDVYTQALQANNPGAVRRINPQDWEK